MNKSLLFFNNTYNIFYLLQILPGLQAFCAACAIGIGSIYLLQASWVRFFKNFFRIFFYWIDFFCFQFVAWLSLDQKRIQDQRDGLLPCCLVHKTPQENEDQTNSSTDSKIPWSKKLLKKAARLIRSKVFKVSWCKIFFWEVSGIFFQSWMNPNNNIADSALKPDLKMCNFGEFLWLFFALIQHFFFFKKHTAIHYLIALFLQF